MTTKEIKKTARMAGGLYFIYFVIHIFADVFGRSKIIIFGDAVATAQNIMASGWPAYVLPSPSSSPISVYHP